MKKRWTAFWLRARQWAGRCRDRIVEWLGRARYRVAEPKESFRVFVGDVLGSTDRRTLAEFQGRRLAQRVYAFGDNRVTETLYKVGHKRYLVHVRTLIRAEGLPTSLDLHEITESELLPGGQYAELGVRIDKGE